MTDPGLPPLPPDALRLLESARDERGPSAEAEARVLRRVGATLGITLAAAELSTASAAGLAAAAAPAAPFGAALAKAGLALVLAGVVGAGAWLASTPARLPLPVLPPHATPAGPPPPVPAAPETPLALPEPPPAAPSAPPAIRPAPAPVRPSPPSERVLLDEARHAIARGEAGAALPLLDRHQRLFARGELAEEREAMRVLALVRLRRLEEARDRADRFFARRPGSIYRRALESALRATPLTEPPGSSQSGGQEAP